MDPPLILPLVLWGETAPSHNITCSVVINDNSLATSSKTGQICIWAISETGALPRLLLSGHSTAVSSILHINFGGNDVLVSASIDGTICMWNCDDGICINSSPNLLSDISPTCIALVHDNVHIAVSGRHREVQIVNLYSLKIVSTLSYHEDWVKGVYPCNLSNIKDSHTILTLCKDTIQFWDLNSEKMVSTPLSLNNSKIDSISICPETKTLITITKQSWSLFSIVGGTQILSIDCPYPKGWAGGSYIDSDHVIIWTYQGRALIYQLPDLSSIPPFSFDAPVDTKIDVDDFGSVTVLYQVILNTDNRHIGYIGCYSKRWFCLSSERGTVSLWKIPEDLHQEGIEGEPQRVSKIKKMRRNIFLHDKSRKFGLNYIDNQDQPSLAPFCKGSFSLGWETKKTNDVSNFDEQQFQQKPDITASCVSLEKMILVRGYSDGSITIQKIPFSQETPRAHRGHRGKVTSLMHATSYREGENRMIISGGEDCRIHLWVLETGDLLHTWSQHSGSIVRLLPLPDHTTSSLRTGLFLSISKDLSIGLFSFESLNCLHMFSGHPAPITSVKLRIDQDYLLVTCEDASVTMWELSTGLYEGYFEGKQAVEITDPATDLQDDSSKRGNMQTSTLSLTSAHKSILSYQLSPVDVLLLNVRRLLQDLIDIFREMKKEPQKYRQDAYKTSLTFTLFSYLVPWGLNQDIDQQCHNELGITAPSPRVSVGLLGHNGILTSSTPAYCRDYTNARWSTSSTISSIHILSSAACTQLLIQQSQDKSTFNSIFSYLYTQLHDNIPNYIPPSITFYLNYWQDQSDQISQASRSLLLSELDRSTPEQLLTLVDDLIHTIEKNKYLSESSMFAPLLLGIIASQNPQMFSSIKSGDGLPFVANSLVRLLAIDKGLIQPLAAEIIGNSYTLWKPFLSNQKEIIHRIILYLMTSDIGPNQNASSRRWIVATALSNIVSTQPVEFTQALADITRRKFQVKEFFSLMSILEYVVKKNLFILLPDLVAIVDCIFKVIEPIKISLPKETIIRTMKSVFMAYPMVSFDNEHQRIALPTKSNQINVYDIKLGTKLYSLEGNNSPVTALAFSPEGKILASYSMSETKIRIWQTTPPLFGFGSPPKKICDLLVARDSSKITQEMALELVKIEFNAARSLILTRGKEKNNIVLQ